MSISWRLGVLAFLLLAPAAAYMAVGAYVLVRDGWFFWTWWVLPISWGAAYLFARRWRRQALVAAPIEEAPLHWTDRDREAWTRVEKAAEQVSALSLEQLSDPQFYWQTSQNLARDLAEVYHPKATDPLGGLTVPEILAAAELAMGDLADTVNAYVPAGHLLTVDRWRLLAKIPGYYRTASNVGWLVGGVLNPIGSAAKYIASKLTVSPATDMLQTNALGWFASAFVQRAGASLIEMYSGRLRVGAKRWRELRAETGGAVANGATVAEPVQRASVTVVVAGQAGAGKASLISALLGNRDATSSADADVENGTRFEMQTADGERLTLVKTPGYAQGGPSRDAVRQTCKVIRKADLVLLVVAANNAARDADLKMLAEMGAWFDENPDLREPPVVAALTHIDLLAPALEWEPPYDDWDDANPMRAKSKAIAAAVKYQEETLGDAVVGCVPMCTDVSRGRVWGVDELLLPKLSAALESARATAMVRTLRDEAGQGKISALAGQLLGAGKLMWKAWRR